MVLSKLIPPQYRLYLLAGALMIAAFAGWKVRDWQCDAAQAKSQRVVIQKTEKATGAVNAASATYETQREALSNETAKDRVLIRTVYRTTNGAVQSAVDCAAPDAVVSVLDRATDRANAAAAGKPVPAVPSPGEATPPAR